MTSTHDPDAPTSAPPPHVRGREHPADPAPADSAAAAPAQPQPPAPGSTSQRLLRRVPRHRLAAPSAALVGFMAVFTLVGGWRLAWWAGALVTFALLVWLAQTGQEVVPRRHLRAYERGLATLFPLLLLAGWELLAGTGALSARWFPPPSDIAVAVWELSVEPETGGTSLLGRPWRLPELIGELGLAGALGAIVEESHVLATLGRVFIGFVLGLAPGIVVGALMGANRTVRIMLDNVMSAFYVLPKIAIFPIVMLLFANPFGEGPIITVVAVSAFFFVAFNTMAGVQGVDRIFLDVGANYGANRLQMFRHVIIPGALPVIFAGFRIALGAALIVVVAVEFVRADQGVGHLTIYYWEVLSPPRMYAGLFTTMALGVLLTFGLLAVEKRVMPWRRNRGDDDLPTG